MDCKKMWIIRTLLMLLAFSAYTYAFYIKTDDVELQHESSDINLENTEDYNNYSPEPRSLGIMETYEKIRNYLTSSWKESNSSNLTPENMQNGSHYENMQQNELTFDPYHLTKNISRSDPVDFHASGILPVLSEKYLKINLPAGQKFEENTEVVKDDFVDDSRFQFKNDAINDIFSDVSESDKELSTKLDDEDEPVDLLRSIYPLDYTEDLVEGQDNKNLERNTENIVDASTDKDNIIEITTEEPNNNIAGDINHITTERTSEEVENMIEDLEDQFSTTRAQVIGTTIIPSDETTYNIQLSLDFIQSNTKTEENYMNVDQVDNFKRETKRKPEKSEILFGDNDDLIVIAGTPVYIKRNEKNFTEAPISLDENDDSLIIQSRRLSSDELTTQFPTKEKTTSTQVNRVNTIPERKIEINILNKMSPSSDITTTIPPIVTSHMLEEYTNTDLDKIIFTTTISTFEESNDQISTTQINQIEENANKITEMIAGDTDDLIVLVTDPSNIQKNKIANEQNDNEESVIIQGRGLNHDELMMQYPEEETALPEIKTEINILNKTKPFNDYFSVTSEHLVISSTTALPITTNHVLKEHTSFDIDENIFTTSTLEESSPKIVKYEEVSHEKTSENIIKLDQIAEKTTLVDQTENIKSGENDDLIVILDKPENVKIEEYDSSIINNQLSETTTSQSEFSTLKVENDTKDPSEYFTTQQDTTLKTLVDVDTTNNIYTEDKVQIEQSNEVTTIVAPVNIDEDLTSPILTDAFNVFEISEELVKPRSILNKSDATLENLGVDEQYDFTNKNIEVTTLYTVETDNSTQFDNQYINHHYQNEELTTEFVTDDQTIKRELFQINPSTEFNEGIDFTTAEVLEHFEKTEDVSDHDQVIYTTTLSDSGPIDNDHHNNYEHTTLSNEQDQIRTITDGVIGRSFDVFMNLNAIPHVTSTQHEEDRQLGLTTEEMKIIDILTTTNSDQSTQSIITAPPFSHIESDEPSKIVSELEAENKTYLPATEVNFRSHQENPSSMRISDQFSDLLHTSNNIFTTELPKAEIIDKKYQNHEFSTISNELEHHEDISGTMKNSVFEESVTAGKIDLENEMTTVNQLYSITKILSDNIKIPQQLELSTEDSKLLEITTKDSFEHATPVFIENQILNSPSDSIINESNESNRTGKSSLEVEIVHNESTKADSTPVKFNDLSVDLTTKFNIIADDDSKSNESNQRDEKSVGDESQQIDSDSKEVSSINISALSRNIASKSSESENNSNSDESNETEEKPSKIESTQAASSEENSSSIEDSDQTIDNKSDVSASDSKENDVSASDSKEESVQSDSIEEDSSSTELADQTTNNKNDSENSESNDSNISGEKLAESKTLNAEKKTDSASNEENSSSVEIDDNDTTPKAVKKDKFDNEDNESNDSNHSGERSSEEFQHIDKNIQSTSTEEDISSLESSDQSDDHDDNIKFKKPHESEEDSSNESVEEIIPNPIQRVHQGRSFSFDNENNNNYGQEITSDEKSPPFTKVVLSDPDTVENVDQSIVVNKLDNSDSNNNRGMEGENTLDSDDVSTAVVETLIEAAELTTEFTRHISSFRTTSEANNTISDTTYETPTTSIPPGMDEFDIEKLHSLTNALATSVGTSKLTVLSFSLIGLAIFAIVATISAALIFKFHKRRETFDIQLEERHEKKDSNTTHSTTNGVE